MKWNAFASYAIYAPSFALVLVSLMLPPEHDGAATLFETTGGIGSIVSAPSRVAISLFALCNPADIGYGYAMSFAAIMEVPSLLVAFAIGLFDAHGKAYEIDAVKIFVSLALSILFIHSIFFDETISRRTSYFICNNGAYFAAWEAIGMAGGVFMLRNLGKRLRPLVSGWLLHLNGGGNV
ncbi:MAG: hypothetical protein EPN20_16645 [Magnetospirillum sp.]|nr:MAG: hypothetical protein EPN20_16645 [Magnetospirillum sp.]